MRIQDKILTTLAYHDIFDYPLTSKEITLFLTQRASQKQVEKALKSINSKIESKNNYYYLKNRSKIVTTRLNRKYFSIQKFKRANFFKNILRLVPSIKLIAVTGSLAVGNSTKRDDIDLLIITSKHTLWTTRLYANLLLWPWKRSPNSSRQSEKACLNIFIDEKDLKIKDENLYTAHEIVQMKIIYNKNNTYNMFVNANMWVVRYLPNWENRIVLDDKSKKITNIRKTHSIYTYNLFIRFVEALSKQIQLKYMKSKQTTEQIGDTQLFFHSKHTQTDILKAYKRKIRTIKY